MCPFTSQKCSFILRIAPLFLRIALLFSRSTFFVSWSCPFVFLKSLFISQKCLIVFHNFPLVFQKSLLFIYCVLCLFSRMLFYQLIEPSLCPFQNSGEIFSLLLFCLLLELFVDQLMMPPREYRKIIWGLLEQHCK